MRIRLVINRKCLIRVKTSKMDSTNVKHKLASVCHKLGEKESTTDRLQRQLYELKKRVDKYFDDLDNVEEMCEQAKADIERFKLKAEAEKDIAKKDAEIQAKLYSAIKEMNEKIERSKEQDKYKTPHAQEDKIPDAAQNTLRYTTSARVCRYIKTGCAFVVDSVAAYALFKITKPFFF